MGSAIREYPPLSPSPPVTLPAGCDQHRLSPHMLSLDSPVPIILFLCYSDPCPDLHGQP